MTILKENVFKAIYITDREDTQSIDETNYYGYSEYDVIVINNTLYNKIEKLLDKDKLKEYMVVKID